MDGQQDLGAIARGIIDANLYMTLATVDEAGRPWVAPVFYAAKGSTQFYWISSPEVTHSRNLARRPHVSIVVFDSQVPASTGQAVYMSAVAEELAGADIDRGLEVYPGPAGRGGRAMTPEQLRPPALYRLYRATVSQHWILCPRSSGPCTVHGRAFDHRIMVTL
ncbi:MAG TPA: pyridoxamine 5'-phosphate oxidase family protein [Actinomycetes bacterium]|nr:pyridoxamine 5'-phosphate oxidase family protein [Actinomycetes bacterium]